MHFVNIEQIFSLFNMWNEVDNKRDTLLYTDHSGQQ